MSEALGETLPAVTWEATGDGVLSIVLDRPPANALGLPVVEGLHAALDRADADPGVKLLVVTSRIPGFFAAGADIKHMATIDGDGFREYGDALRGALDRL